MIVSSQTEAREILTRLKVKRQLHLTKDRKIIRKNKNQFIFSNPFREEVLTINQAVQRLLWKEIIR